MDKLHLEIVTPEGLIFSNNVKMVVLPGSEGEFGVLPGHASLVSILKIGVLEIENMDGSKDEVAINWGYAEVSENKVTVLADGAVHIGGSNQSELAKSLDEARKLIRGIGDESGLSTIVLSKIDNLSKAR